MNLQKLQRTTRTGIVLLLAFLLFGLIQVATQRYILLKYSFHIVSILFVLILFYFCYYVYRNAGVKLNKTSAIIITAACVLGCLMFLLVVELKPLLYFYDSTTYYRSTIMLLDRYTSQPVTVFRVLADIYQSIYTQNYSNIITAFSAFPFFLTDWSGEAYIISTAFLVVPSIFFLLGCLMIKIGDSLHFTARKMTVFMVLSYALTLSMPVLFMSAMGNRPDYWGVIFTLSCILLAWDKTLDKMSIPALILMVIALWLMVTARRWYQYWALMFVAVIVVRTFAEIFFRPKEERNQALVRVIVFGISAVAFVLVSLYPLIEKVLETDFTEFQGYYYGGFTYEINNQYQFLGLVPIIIIAGGLLFGVFRKQLRVNAAMYFIVLLGSIFLFTRIHNMGAHHSLLLVPMYLLFSFFAIAGLLHIRYDWIRRMSLCTLSAFLVLSAHNAISERQILPQTTSMLTYRHLNDILENKAPIEEVSRYVLLKKPRGEKVFFLFHDSISYNASLFREILLPDLSLDGSMINTNAYHLVASSPFPAQLFTNAYVVTCDPYLPGQSELNRKLQDAFFASPVFATSFSLEKSFDMGNGYTLTFYRRTVAFSIAELDYYYEAFAQEREKYPQYYDPVFSNLRTAGNQYSKPEWQLAGPENLHSISATANSITMAWDPVDGAGYYRFYLNGACIEPHVDGAEYICTGLDPNTVYGFKVASVSDVGMVGLGSENVSVRTKVK